MLHILDDKYDIDDNEATVSEVMFIRKYDLSYRPPLQSDHDYSDIPNFTRVLHGFSEFKKAVISYIAGFVGKILSQKNMCFVCNDALGSKTGDSISPFLTLKDRGSLFKPSLSLVKVCEDTEIRLHRMLSSTHGKIPQGNNSMDS